MIAVIGAAVLWHFQHPFNHTVKLGGVSVCHLKLCCLAEVTCFRQFCMILPHELDTSKPVHILWLVSPNSGNIAEKLLKVMQGSHRAWKYLNIQDCLENSLKIKFALKSTWKNTQRPWKVFEFYHFSVFGDLDQYQIVVPLFVAAYAAPNKGTTILY